MKFFLSLFVLSFLLFACATDTKEQEKEVEEISENPIVGRWKLQSSKQTKDAKENEVNVKAQPTELILSIMEGGYFVVYDTFIDPRFNQKGFSRISERSKGQWELINDSKLVLHHNFDDSTRIEELNIKTLNKNTLVTVNSSKQSQVYKTYEGY